MHSLKHKGKMYIVPDWLNDDLFCMVATLSDQQSCSSSIDPLAKIHTVLITNDLFRDHARKIRDGRLLRKWYWHHCHGHCRLSGKVRLPTKLNRRIEWNYMPNDGPSASSDGNKVWHFPVSGWNFYERFMVKLPATSSLDKS